MTPAAGVCALLLSLGFGIPGFVGTRHFAQHPEIRRFLGFPTCGEGLFERNGIPTTVPLLAGFVVVCAAEVVLGALLLAGWRPALWLSLVPRRLVRPSTDPARRRHSLETVGAADGERQSGHVRQARPAL